MNETLDQLKYYRRSFVELIEAEGFDHHRIAQLAVLHTAIQAFEAVADEPPPEKTGPRLVYNEDGWPVQVDEKVL